MSSDYYPNEFKFTRKVEYKHVTKQNLNIQLFQKNIQNLLGIHTIQIDKNR